MAAGGATGITFLTCLSIWGQWRALAIVAGIQAVVIPFNIWVNVIYLPLKGRRAEIVRTVVNLSTALVVNEVTGWPLPVWLWLPFIALAFDHLDRRVALWTFGSFIVVQNTAALIQGVQWIYPVMFTAFAVFCSEISRQRFKVIRGMLHESDRHRRALQHAELELRQAQKLESVGRLAAGVAHEINTPVQFVTDSIHFVRDATQEMGRLLKNVQASEESDLPYLLEQTPKAIDRALDGLHRVTTIVRSMKEFAHPGSKDMQCVDLNRAIQTTLTLARNEYKYVAELQTDFAEDLPHVQCFAGDLNQVVLNLIVNASHAVGDAVCGTESKGRIIVKTKREGNDAVIAIADTGTGIPEHCQDRIFDPFFTTKEVGKGTGQGLVIARAIVVDKHKGQLSFETAIGEGTTFYVRLPITQQASL